VAKMDTAEVYAPMRERLRLTILLASLLLISAGLGVGAIWRHQRSRFYKERYKMAETLRASEVRYRRLFETAKDGILILDAGTGTVMDVNPFLVEKLGFPREALLGKKIWELGFFKDIVANEAKFEELQNKEYIRYEELPLKTSDGRRINVEFVSNVYLVNDHKVIQCNIRDITERKQAEEALRQAHDELEKRVAERTVELSQERQLLRTLINNLPDGIYAKDTAGRKIMVNPADLKVLGCQTEAEAIGKSDFDLFPKDVAEKFWADDQKVIRGEPVINREEFVLDEQGRKSWLLTSKLPLRDQAGKIVGLVGIGRNITGQKQAEEALHQSHDELEKRVAERTAELAGTNATLQQQIAERERIEQVLDRERLLLRTLIDNLPDAIYAKDATGRKTMANLADLKNLRCQTEVEAVGKSDFDLFPKDVAEKFWADDQKVIQGQPVINREEHFFDEAGEKRWLLTSKLPLRDQTGKIVGLVGIGHDITEHKRAEEALRQEQTLMATLMENVPDAIYFKDATSRFIRANRALSRKFGLNDPAQLIGKSDADFFSVEHAQQALADEREIIRTGRPLLNVEERETWIDGTVSWVLTTKLPLRDAAGRVIGTCGISLDISDRKRVEQALAERTEDVSQRNQALADANATLQQQIAVRERIEQVLDRERDLLRTLIDSLPDYVYAKDAEGRFVIANLGVARQLGFESPNAVIGKSDFELFPHELAARYRADEQEILRSGKGLYSHEGPTVDASKPEKNRWVSTTKVPLRNDLGEITGFVGLGHDITERKRVEEALQKSSQELQERNDELARFTYTASHDLKSPLVTVKAFLGYLEQDTSNQDAEAIKKDRQYIYTAVDKMTRLLDELLDLARVGRKMNPPEEMPLQVVVKDALDLVAGWIIQKGVEVVVTKEPIMLCGDRTRLVEVFQNLVDNAIKFMGDQPAPRVEIGVEKAGEENVFFVRDNGIGIDPRYQPKVFGLFEKYDPGTRGTGIGLALVKRIVEVHGGKIWVESAGIGKGATFRFTLAKTQPHPAPP
jgi:PAS domain S-box-containing protein